MADFKNVIEGVFTKNTAGKLFYSRYLEIIDDGRDRPYYKGSMKDNFIYTNGLEVMEGQKIF
ncbi:hypothetical protein JI735_34455 (plasmid) [Paenibacillus sonchi]|uniref:Uncharacterized protein n=1 Tax=Paenibacillus sonchi TaxID=373687 RepID=A0A974SGE4_9BACL|nr:hypothetical protein [Paenibacillus sonchi]QQZ64539.1 hypothetical protein JI735_34455 [Paenibacillus sonchi]